ncbi:MAG: hypothetical protein ACOCVG_03655, partial [Verrucomicrobiota bacterium]
MDIAIVTGADSSNGVAISRRLVRMGCRVYGLGRDFSRIPFSHGDFRKVQLDLTQVDELVEAVRKIREIEGGAYCYVHATAYWPEPTAKFTEIPVGELEAALKINLYVPSVLSRLLLEGIGQLQGHLFYVLRPPEGGAGNAPIWAMVEQGLRRFGESLFEQVRESGARMTLLRLLETSAKDGSAGQRVDPEQTADAIERVMQSRDGNVVTEMAVRPQLETPGAKLPRTALEVDPYKQITLPPPEKRPAEGTPIPTPERESRPLEVETESMSEEEAAAEAEAIEREFEEEVRRLEEAREDLEAERGRGRRNGGDGSGNNDGASGGNTGYEPDKESGGEDEDGEGRRRGRRRGRRGGRRRRGGGDRREEESKPQGNSRPQGDSKPEAQPRPRQDSKPQDRPHRDAKPSE